MWMAQQNPSQLLRNKVTGWRYKTEFLCVNWPLCESSPERRPREHQHSEEQLWQKTATVPFPIIRFSREALGISHKVQLWTAQFPSVHSPHDNGEEGKYYYSPVGGGNRGQSG